MNSRVNGVCEGFGSLPWRLTWVIGRSLRTLVQGEQGEDYVFWVESQPLQPDVELSQQLQLVYQICVFSSLVLFLQIYYFCTCIEVLILMHVYCCFPLICFIITCIWCMLEYLLMFISTAKWCSVFMFTFLKLFEFHHFSSFISSVLPQSWRI